MPRAPFLNEIGINLFNFSFEHSINEIRELAGPEVALLGNLPPRDILAAGTPEEVKIQTEKMWNEVEDKKGIIWSCGGGVPQNVPTENMKAFIETIQRLEIQ
jgi:uroporphyrinogen decarboxylase